MPSISAAGKVTLLDIKRRHGLSAAAIAAMAMAEPALVYVTEQGGVLARKDLQKILRGLSRVTRQGYSIETVAGYWIEQEDQV